MNEGEPTQSDVTRVSGEKGRTGKTRQEVLDKLRAKKRVPSAAQRRHQLEVRVRAAEAGRLTPPQPTPKQEPQKETPE